MNGPLSGVRVLDFTIQLAGPLSTMLLGEMGAEIIKVEQPGKGAPERAGSPSYHGLSAYFMGTGWNKKSITVNLKTEEGLNIVKQLVKGSDVAVQNFRPGVAERLGIGFEDLHRINDQLVYCSISGFDPAHPYGSKPSFDLIAQGLTGVLSLYTDHGHRPTIPLSLADLTTGLMASHAILGAMFNRERTGRGEHVKVSLFQSSLFLLSPIVQGLLQGLEDKIDTFTRVKHVGFLGVFKDIGGRYFVVEAPDDNFFQRFAMIPELKEIAVRDIYATKSDRAKNWAELDEEMQKAFSTKGRDYWLKVIDEAGVPCAPVLSVDEVFGDSFNLRYLAGVNDNKIGSMRTVAYPANFTLSGSAQYRRPPMLGEHTDEILESLGYGPAKIEDLRKRNII
ncbi:MAG: CoA transferase [Nitrososphaerota archaeon]|nr:CoA transferase [Nitrososphaerota archaeon]